MFQGTLCDIIVKAAIFNGDQSIFQTWLGSRLEALCRGGRLIRAKDAFEGEQLGYRGPFCDMY